MPPGAIEVPLVRDGDLRLTPVSIEGRPPALFEFDLGAGGTLAVSPAYARERNLLDGRPTSQGTVVGVGGAADLGIPPPPSPSTPASCCQP